MVTEADRWRREGRNGQGPVWATKEETDASFNHGMERTLSTIAGQVRETGRSSIDAVFATHNSISTDLGIQLLEKYGLAKRQAGGGRLVVSDAAAGSVTFAQLYGKLRPFSLESSHVSPALFRNEGRPHEQNHGVYHGGRGIAPCGQVHELWGPEGVPTLPGQTSHRE